MTFRVQYKGRNAAIMREIIRARRLNIDPNYAEIGDKYGLTRERIRQIASKLDRKEGGQLLVRVGKNYTIYKSFMTTPSQSEQIDRMTKKLLTNRPSVIRLALHVLWGSIKQGESVYVAENGGDELNSSQIQFMISERQDERLKFMTEMLGLTQSTVIRLALARTWDLLQRGEPLHQYTTIE